MEKTKILYNMIMGMLILLSAVALFMLLIFKIVPTENRELVSGVVGAMSMWGLLVVKHFFDGNIRSADRDQMLFKSTPPPSPSNPS